VTLHDAIEKMGVLCFFKKKNKNLFLHKKNKKNGF